jgi:2-keto-4-pentenoate hydratase/2-oxohepta-3-ene-1,7-dioic acid hydratase in catechol pathway
MRLITYRTSGLAGEGYTDGTGVGVMVDDKQFIDLAKQAPNLPKTLRGLLESGPDWQSKVEKATSGKSADNSIDNVALDPVIPNPQATWCLALNFQLHKDETGLERSQYPELFQRMPCTVVGHNQPLVRPRPELCKRYDFEGEVAFIVGKRGRYVSEKDAFSYIAGYAPYNEGSVREFQGHNRQFGLGKNFEKSGSFGPWMMTADEFGDPYKQYVKTRVNGVLKQDTQLSEMLNSFENIVSYLSTGYEIRPGDVCAIGTPGSIPGTTKLLSVGDTCEIEITGLGTLSNKVIAAD